MFLIPREEDIPFNLTSSYTSSYTNASSSSSSSSSSSITTNKEVDNIGLLLVVLALVSVTVTAVVVSSRIYSRAVLLGFVGVDDYSILAATAAAIGLTVVSCMGVHYGIGKHMWDVPLLNLVEIIKLAYISQLIHTVSLGFTKASLSLLIVRISTTNRTIKLTWMVFGITTAAMVSTLIASIFQCAPIHYRWEKYNPMSNLKGTCVRYDLLQYSMQGINIVTDLVMWLLPLRLITQVKLPRRQKWGLYIVFLLGFLAPIASIIKLIVLTNIVVSPDTVPDISYTDSVKIYAWGVIEANIAIICCSMPTIRPLLKKLIPGLLGS